MYKAVKYLEKKNLLETYWGQIIADASYRDGGMFNDFEIESASEWMSCACGQLDSHIERYDSGMPTDGELELLGRKFNDYVGLDRKLKAAKTLYKIEKRAIELYQLSLKSPLTE